LQPSPLPVSPAGTSTGQEDIRVFDYVSIVRMLLILALAFGWVLASAQAKKP
jgi:hypothetical protein